MEGKHIKNDNFHPIIQFRKGQTFLAKSNSTARLSVIGILQYSCQHSEIGCLPTGTARNVVGLFPKQRRKLKSDRIAHSIYGRARSRNVDAAEMTALFKSTCSCIFCLRKKERGTFSGEGARTAQSLKYCRGWSCKRFWARCFFPWIPLLKLMEVLKQISF